jgi:hypothetical protein
VRVESKWTVAALGVSTAVALADALLGRHLILIGLLIAGPMLAAVDLAGPRTVLVAGYALVLAVALGPVDGIWGTPDHLIRCLVVVVGGGFATPLPSAAPAGNVGWPRSPRWPRSPSGPSCGPSRPGWAR